jgi:hypothetical protein
MIPGAPLGENPFRRRRNKKWKSPSPGKMGKERRDLLPRCLSTFRGIREVRPGHKYLSKLQFSCQGETTAEAEVLDSLLIRTDEAVKERNIFSGFRLKNEFSS